MIQSSHHHRPNRLLVTGANGFIGSRVLDRLAAECCEAVGAVRQGAMKHPGWTKWMHGPDLGPDADWEPLLTGTDVVIHTAARVHMMQEDSNTAGEAHRLVNTQGTLALARQAAAAGVRRFIFISTIKVMGEQSRRPFRAGDTPAPSDAYARSKLDAEQGLEAIGHESGMEWVIIRPPLVYGPGVGGNFATLVKWLARGIPLPLGAIDNRRSLVARDNLVDLIATCVDHPAAANRTFMVSDGEDLSTTALIRRLSEAMEIRPWLIPVPARALLRVGRLLGQGPLLERLCGDLQVDIEDTKSRLGWHPRIDVDTGLRQALMEPR
ncbi:NAD-dependent epimerase/dehydratase family protein [Thauera sp. AutoDN2]|uniref:NAD-dependent epimerase/dehydratase family protein n=1 Tax=Thauera sp. AutoDN2 TaxID=3416051 RepID=UPI003F4AFCC7